jgi:hypothetical protein
VVEAADIDDAIVKMTDPAFDPHVAAVVEGTAASLMPTSFQAASRATVTEQRPQHITIQAAMGQTGLLVVSDLYDPSWKAYIDGHEAPILPTNIVMRGIVVPAGNHVVEFVYQPLTFLIGSVISLITLMLMLVVSGTIVVRRRSRGRQPKITRAEIV